MLTEPEVEEGSFWRRQLLWVRDMYGPLSVIICKKNMEQKPHSKDSADEDELFDK